MTDAPAREQDSPPARARARILHVLAPAPYGGLEHVVNALATLQHANGHEVHVAAVLDEGVHDHPMLTGLTHAGVATHPIPVPPRAYQVERREVRALCEQVRPHLMHTHGYRPDVLHSRVARDLGVPVVSTSHGFTGGGLKNRFFELLQRRTFRRCDAVIAVSRPMAAMLLASGVAKSRVHCIPNAFAGAVDFLSREDARAALGLGADDFAVGFIGRLGHEKGPDILLDALAETDSDVRAVVIGDGRLRPALRQRTHALGLAERIHWAGAIDRAAKLIRAFDIFVLSSRTEGTPIVLLEAMAAGVPIVATRVGGVPGVVSNREAILVSSESPSALAGAIAEVRGNPEAAAWRTERARERLESHFSATRWLDRYDDVYRSIIAARPAAEPLAG